MKLGIADPKFAPLPACFLLFCAVLAVAGCATDMATGHALSAKGFYEKAQYDQAIQDAKQSTQLDPAYAPGWYWLGVAYYRKGNYNEAISALHKVIELKPASNQVQSSHNYLGWSYYMVKNFNEAIRDFNKAIELKPTDADSLQGRALSYYWLGNYDQAIKDLDRTIENVIPDDKAARQNALRWRAWSDYRKGDYDEAIRDASRSIENADPNNKTVLEHALLCRGWSYYFKSSFNEAIRDFNRAIENNDPKEKFQLRDGLRGKAYAYAGLGDSETAFNLIKKAKEALDYNINFDLSLMYYAIGDRERAWQYRGGRGMIGTAVQDYKNKEVAGAGVVRVEAESPAGKAGIFAGDVIVKINQKDIKSSGDLLRETAALPPKTLAEIKLLREGKEKQVTLEVASAEKIMEANPLLSPLMAKVRDRSPLPPERGTPAPPAEPIGAPPSTIRKDLPKVAVWDLVPREVKATYAQELTSILVSEITKLKRYEVYSQENVRTLAGWTEERMKLGCSSTQCLTALGQMDIQKLISGSVGKIGNRYSVSVNLFDTQNAKAEDALSEFCRSEDELIDLVQVVVRKLLGAETSPPRQK